MAPAAYAAIAEVEALAARPEAARAALDRGFEILGRAAVHPTARTGLRLAEVLVLAAEADLAGAQAAALEAAQEAGEAVMIEAEMLHCFMRVGGAAERVAGRLREIAGGAESALVELWANQAAAASAADGDALMALAERYAQLEARIFAAEAAAQAAAAFAVSQRRRPAPGRGVRRASGASVRGQGARCSSPRCGCRR